MSFYDDALEYPDSSLENDRESEYMDPVTALLDEPDETRLLIAKDGSLRDLKALLNDENEEIRETAAKTLASLGSESILVEKYNDVDLVYTEADLAEAVEDAEIRGAKKAGFALKEIKKYLENLGYEENDLDEDYDTVMSMLKTMDMRYMDTLEELDDLYRDFEIINDRIVLEKYDTDYDNQVDALVFWPTNPSPFVVAHNFNSETGEWGSGDYYTNPAAAHEALCPDILENGCFRLTSDTINSILASNGYPATEKNIEILKYNLGDLKELQQQFSEDVQTCVLKSIDACNDRLERLDVAIEERVVGSNLDQKQDNSNNDIKKDDLAR